MTCSSRSTTWATSLLLVLAGGTLSGPARAGATGQAADGQESAVRQAIVQAVTARMGAGADVRIEALHAKVAAGNEDMTLLATPEPGARFAQPSRFTLSRVVPGGSGPKTVPRPAGYAVATVTVAVPHVRAGRSIARGDVCAEADLVPTDGEVGAVLIQPLPTVDEVVGARAVRDLAAQEVLTRSVVAARPFVQSGDVVAVRATADGVTVRGQAVAEQSGRAGDVIRVVNRDSRRALRARVIGRDEVEVVQ